MAIFLLILKIIGITLLSILGLVLLVIMLVLFVPIRYQIKGNLSEDKSDIKALAVVSYLLHIVNVKIFYEDGIPGFKVRLLGIPLRLGKDKKEKKKRENKKKVKYPKEQVLKPDNNEEIDSSPESYQEPLYTIETWEDIQQSEISENTNEMPEESEEHGPDNELRDDNLEDNVVDDSKDVSDTEDCRDKASVIETIVNKLSGIVNSVKNLILKIYDVIYNLINDTDKTIKKVSKEIDFYSRYIKDERNRKAFSKCITALKRIVNSIKPKKIKGNIRLGMDDPATTGKILMYLSMLYPVMPKKLVIIPDFENKVIEGNVNIKGRIFICVLAWAAIRIYFDKDFKRMLRIMKRHRDK